MLAHGMRDFSGCKSLLASALLTLAACDMQKLAVNQTAAVLKAGAPAFDTETDIAFAEAAIPGGLKTMESFLYSDPEQRELLEMLASGYAGYAFGFVEDAAEVAGLKNGLLTGPLQLRARDLYLRARMYAIRLLELDAPDLAQSLRAGTQPSDAQLVQVDQDALPGLFWTASAWLSAINAGKEDMAMVAELGIVKTLVQRAYAIDPTYFHAGPTMLMGALEASTPKALGGRPDKAATYFDEAEKITESKFLLIPTLKARFVVTQLGDAALFQTTLERVLSTSPDIDPAAALANRLAQRRAARYLQQREDFFLEE